MPQSRKRKKRHHSSSGRQSSRNRSSNTLKILVIVTIALIFIAGAVFVFSGGGGKSPAPGEEVTTSSGLKYVDEVVGSGASPKPGSAVTVHYTGTLVDGTKFDSSVDRGQPYTFRIGTGSVIRGWDEGLMSMKVGGKRRLIVPPELGYGPNGKGKIPPNSTLVFEVELLSVK